MLTQARLLELVHYDPATGEFRARVQRGNRKVGALLGTLTSHGYLKVTIDGEASYLHRFAWFYMTGAWPEGDVDHINGNGADNRWSNLREAAHFQNMHNVGLRADNSSGVRGVYFNRQKKRWQASVTVNGRRVSLGRFKSLEEAGAAVKAAGTRLVGEFYRHA